MNMCQCSKCNLNLLNVKAAKQMEDSTDKDRYVVKPPDVCVSAFMWSRLMTGAVLNIYHQTEEFI